MVVLNCCAFSCSSRRKQMRFCFFFFLLLLMTYCCLHLAREIPIAFSFRSLSAAVSRRTRTSTAVRRMSSNDNTPSNSKLPALIDVDCNLWHRDLKSLQKQKQGDDNVDDDEHNKITTLLNEDAVVEQNVVAVLSPSSTLEEARNGLSILTRQQHHQEQQQQQQWPVRRVKTTVGIHPYHVLDDELKGKELSEVVDAMKELVLSSSDGDHNNQHVAAIGECGLDTTEGFPPLHEQLPYFRAQVEIAHTLKLPLFVHERGAFDDCAKILSDGVGDVRTTTPVIIHCFTGTQEHCVEYIRRGYYISISGYLFKEDVGEERGSEVAACLENGLIPLDRLMLETDAPYMGFPGCREAYLAKNEEYLNSLNSKKRRRLTSSFYPNLSSSLPQVLDKVLEHINKGRTDRNEDLLTREELALCTSRNANRFFQFGLDDNDDLA